MAERNEFPTDVTSPGPMQQLSGQEETSASQPAYRKISSAERCPHLLEWGGNICDTCKVAVVNASQPPGMTAEHSKADAQKRRLLAGERTT